MVIDDGIKWLFQQGGFVVMSCLLFYIVLSSKKSFDAAIATAQASVEKNKALVDANKNLTQNLTESQITLNAIIDTNKALSEQIKINSKNCEHITNESLAHIRELMIEFRARQDAANVSRDSK